MEAEQLCICLRFASWPESSFQHPEINITKTGMGTNTTSSILGCHSACDGSNIHKKIGQESRVHSPRQHQQLLDSSASRDKFIRTDHLFWGGMYSVNKHIVMKFESVFRHIQFIFLMIMFCYKKNSLNRSETHFLSINQFICPDLVVVAIFV